MLVPFVKQKVLSSKMRQTGRQAATGHDSERHKINLKATGHARIFLLKAIRHRVFASKMRKCVALKISVV